LHDDLLLMLTTSHHMAVATGEEFLRRNKIRSIELALSLASIGVQFIAHELRKSFVKSFIIEHHTIRTSQRQHASLLSSRQEKEIEGLKAPMLSWVIF